MKSLDLKRVVAVVRRELLDYRRKRSIVVTMMIFPIVFLVEPVIVVFVAPPTGSPASLEKAVIVPIIYMLLIAVVTPSTLAAYTIVGEREQGTLEPLLTTPLRQQELVIGKAAAVMIPSVSLAYIVYGVFLICVALFARHDVSSAVFHDGPTLLALFLFAPLVAGWAVVVGLAVSVRATEVRVAQQLGMLASFPMIGVIVLLISGVIHPTFSSALEFGVGLLIVDLVALRLVSGMFNRERLVTGTKAST
ncbi:MAG TPA: ABC transporter permease subunit [Acidimicrobiales bacterium]|jgi:ABC-type Na+ efflux pump permease subunit|nr:ABC transporter permease subunit [Acidimicrobiales bacterium]